jgi:hypothetical protein
MVVPNCGTRLRRDDETFKPTNKKGEAVLGNSQEHDRAAT